MLLIYVNFLYLNGARFVYVMYFTYLAEKHSWEFELYSFTSYAMRFVRFFIMTLPEKHRKGSNSDDISCKNVLRSVP